jgi:hypothetical protein
MPKQPPLPPPPCLPLLLYHAYTHWDFFHPSVDLASRGVPNSTTPIARPCVPVCPPLHAACSMHVPMLHVPWPSPKTGPTPIPSPTPTRRPVFGLVCQRQVEDTEGEFDSAGREVAVSILAPCVPGQWVRDIGSDIAVGEVVLAKGASSSSSLCTRSRSRALCSTRSPATYPRPPPLLPTPDAPHTLQCASHRSPCAHRTSRCMVPRIHPLVSALSSNL